MLRFIIVFLLPYFVNAAVQCYVGQKLFSYESNNAICARFIPYHCATQCEWRKNCSSHASFQAFHGRRTFVSGLLISSKSLMVLCCASMATRLETDDSGREKCVWRDTESIAVLGPSIRTNPVLAPNHYIRDVRMDRDGSSRVDVTLEVCQYLTEREHCTTERMNDFEKRRFNMIQQKLLRLEAKSEPKPVAQAKPADNVKTAEDDKAAGNCESLASSDCGKEIQPRIQICCRESSNCDSECMQNVEKLLMEESARISKGCTQQEIRQGMDCFGRKLNSHIS